MERPTLICDVDNTLLNTRPRVRACLAAIGRAEVFWQSPRTYGGFKAFLDAKEADQFWQVFLSDQYLDYDEPLPDAAKVLHAWSGQGRLVYLTGRHDAPGDSMREGTVGWLDAHGYPLPGGDGVALVMKPVRVQTDLEYKRAALEDLHARFQLWAGLGDLPHEGPLYASFGLKPILVSEVGLFSVAELQGSHPEVVVAASWNEVAGCLELNLK